MTLFFYVNAPDIVNANRIMNQAALEFSTWCCNNRLSINTKKSKCLLFSNKLPRRHELLKKSINIRFGTDNLELVSDYKYLGIYLDENLKFLKHLNYLRGISSRIYTLTKARNYI